MKTVLWFIVLGYIGMAMSDSGDLFKSDDFGSTREAFMRNLNKRRVFFNHDGGLLPTVAIHDRPVITDAQPLNNFFNGRLPTHVEAEEVGHNFF